MPKWYFWGTPESESERSARESAYKFAPGRRVADRPYIPTLDHRTLTAMKVAIANNDNPGWPGDRYSSLVGGNIYSAMDGNGIYGAEIKQLFRELYNDRSIMFGEISFDSAHDFRKFRQKNPRVIGSVQDSHASCSCNSCGNCRNPGVIRDGKFIKPVCEACANTKVGPNGLDICMRAACHHDDVRVVETLHRRAEMYEVRLCRKCGLKEEVPISIPISDRQFLNTYEAAKALGVGHCRIRQLLRQNRFDGAVKTSRDWIIPFASVDAMRNEIGPDAVRKRVGGRGHSFSQQPLYMNVDKKDERSGGGNPYGMSEDALNEMIDEWRAPSDEDPKPAKKIDGRTYAGRAAKEAIFSDVNNDTASMKKSPPLDVKKTSPKKRPSKPAHQKGNSSKTA